MLDPDHKDLSNLHHLGLLLYFCDYERNGDEIRTLSLEVDISELSRRLYGGLARRRLEGDWWEV